MGRAVAAVIVAELVWSVLWLGGSGAASAVWPEVVRPGQPLLHTGVLLGFLAYSVCVSVLSGYVAAAVRGHPPMRTVWTFAFIQLAIGTAVEVAGWGLAPAWYHVAFLALLVPAIVWGRQPAREGRSRTVGRSLGAATARTRGQSTAPARPLRPRRSSRRRASRPGPPSAGHPVSA